jgi:murein DD-endopeptidase MepM/ murein hydrolase activator NlpD
LATSHDIVLQDHVHLRRPRSRAALIAPALAAGAALMLTLAGPSAHAAPGVPAAPQGQSELAEAEAALRSVQESVATAEETVQRLTVEAEAVADQSLVAQAELLTAQQEADARMAELAAAQASVGQTQGDVAALARQTYMGADAYGSASAFFGAGSPTEVLQRAAMLEQLGDSRAEQLDELEFVQRQQQAATEAAKAAVDARDEAAQAAAEAERLANDKLATAQQSYDAAVGEKAALEQKLQEARERVVTLGGDAAPAAAAVQQAGEPGSGGAAQAASSGGQAAAGAGIPTSGRVTSCYGARWGTMHYGVDIAAPIGTPIYAPEGGVVLQAGPASGFGLAVYLQHADGSITVYGHISSFSVAAGQQVSAGDQIAEVGNTGQSTGPHLHFEVHQGGLYQNRTNPVPWLAARGMPLGGSCG